MRDPQGVADGGLRLRELMLLHEVTRVLQRDEPDSPAEWLAAIALAVRRSWPHPGKVEIRVRLGNVEAATAGFEGLFAAHSGQFTAADGRAGSIDVAYRDRSPAANEDRAPGPLLAEVAEMLCLAVNARLTATALRQSEQRYRSVVEYQSDLVCRYLPDTTLTFVNDAYCRFFGRSRDELIGRRFIELIPDADRPAALAHVESLLRGNESRVDEHNVLLPDGSVGRQQWVDHVIASPDGSVEELQGIGRDITARWRTEEALRESQVRLQDAYERIRSLAHRLLLAQEAERTEIARDLHDDVSQQLAALGIGLSMVEARADAGGNVVSEVARLRQMASGLADKVRHVSHALHPGVLQHAGLSAALASHCEAVARQHTFSVTFSARGRVDDTPDNVALCLYRAVQQALRNVAMHANATRAWVTLSGSSNRLDLTIADNGRGFDASEVRARGLGLLSIEERVHLVKGSFSITSRPGGGCKLAISVPVDWDVTPPS